MRHFPSVAAAALLAASSFAQEPGEWSEWARPKDPLGNITVTPEGRVFASVHQFHEPRFRVVEVRPDGSTRPFPNAKLAQHDPDNPLSLDSVLGIRTDGDGVVWMLDNAMRGRSLPKLLGWHVGEFRLRQVVYLPPGVTRPNSFLNDFQVDSGHRHAYIADPAGGSNAALIIVNLETGESRRVLEGHESVVPENVDLVIDGRVVAIPGPDGQPVPARVGVNPIALSYWGEHLYFGPMHGTKLYRIDTESLRNAALPAEELEARVEVVGPRPVSDGITIDVDNNIYITDLAANGVGVLDTNTKEYRLLFADPRISWPDAFSFGPDGRLYGVANQLHRSAVLNGGRDESQPPFLVFTVVPLAGGHTGR